MDRDLGEVKITSLSYLNFFFFFDEAFFNWRLSLIVDFWTFFKVFAYL